MKLKSAVLLSSVLVSTAAFGQEPAAPEASAAAPAPAAAPAAAPVNKSIVPYGVLVGYANLTDSSRANAPDFFQYITRFGLKVSEGVAKAQFELNVNGNGAQKSDAKDSTSYDTVTIRRADVGLDLPSKTGVRFGRYRLGNPEVWGMDATYSVDGFGGSDGVLVTQGIDISEGNSITLKAGVANALSVPSSENYAYGASSPTWNSDSKAILGAIDAKFAGVSAGVYFGIDGKQKVSKESAAVVDDTKTTTVNEAKAAVLANYRPATHIEAALGYNLDGIGGGVAFQQITLGEVKSYANEGGKLKDGKTVETFGKGDDVQPGKNKVTNTLISVGVNGDSSLFGLTGIVQTGDKLVYGGSVALKSTRNSEAKGAAKDAEKDADITQFVVGGGYNAGGFTLELDVAYESTKAKSYSNSKGEAGKSKNKVETKLVGIYAF
ncbi:MAG: hypothetical protein IOD12_05690 [Silvanigrellales bacterium]|nr:hypothetical protein [Silvanigrellales bacterium]